ncbi:hypothetical protein FQR65_LT20978 [Abscondita terminalis]|nr:hypothetical protein FQR65_LT20978 [Abscondita terminalis]
MKVREARPWGSRNFLAMLHRIESAVCASVTWLTAANSPSDYKVELVTARQDRHCRVAAAARAGCRALVTAQQIALSSAAACASCELVTARQMRHCESGSAREWGVDLSGIHAPPSLVALGDPRCFMGQAGNLAQVSCAGGLAGPFAWGQVFRVWI